MIADYQSYHQEYEILSYPVVILLYNITLRKLYFPVQSHGKCLNNSEQRRPASIIIDRYGEQLSNWF